MRYRVELSSQQPSKSPGQRQSEPQTLSLFARFRHVDVKNPLHVAGGTPGPSSSTRYTTRPLTAVMLSVTELRSGACLMALLSRLTRICSTRLASVSQFGSPGLGFKLQGDLLQVSRRCHSTHRMAGH